MMYIAMRFSDKPLIGIQDGEIQVRRMMDLGSTSPITTVGSVIQANSEFLAAFCAAQFLSPGLPVVFGCLALQRICSPGVFLSPRQFDSPSLICLPP